MFKESRSAEQPPKLREALKRRKAFFDKLAKSPWSWAAAAVMALENQGCSVSLPRQVGWLALEPDASSVKWSVGVGSTQRGAEQTSVGNLPQAANQGLSVGLEFAPPRGKPTIEQTPEGVKGDIVVVHAVPADQSIEQKLMPRAGETAQQRLNRVMQHKIKPEDIAKEKAKMVERGLLMFMPQLNGKQDGIKIEMVERRGSDTAESESHKLSSRMSPLKAPAQESRLQKAQLGHKLEHEMLADAYAMEAMEIYFSTERSSRYSDRLAQAALETEPMVLRGYAEAHRLLIDLRIQLLGLKDAQSANRKTAEQLQTNIQELEQRLENVFELARARSIESAVGKLLPLTQNNELRLYVRWEEDSGTLQVLAVLDDPLTK